MLIDLFKKTGGCYIEQAPPPYTCGSMYSPTKEIPKLLLVCSAGDPTPTGREFFNQPAKAVAFGAVQQTSRDQGKGDGQPDPLRFQTPFFLFSHEPTRFVDYFPICL